MAAAPLGYLLLWSFLPISLMLIVVQEMVNRMGIVTGKGPSGLIREKFGVRATFYLTLGIVITNFGNIMTDHLIAGPAFANDATSWRAQTSEAITSPRAADPICWPSS